MIEDGNRMSVQANVIIQRNKIDANKRGVNNVSFKKNIGYALFWLVLIIWVRDSDVIKNVLQHAPYFALLMTHTHTDYS